MTPDGLQSGNIHPILLTLINGIPTFPSFPGAKSKTGGGGKCKGCLCPANSSHDSFLMGLFDKKTILFSVHTIVLKYTLFPFFVHISEKK